MKSRSEQSTDELMAELQITMNKLYDRAWAGDKEAIAVIAEIAKQSHGHIINAMMEALRQQDEPT